MRFTADEIEGARAHQWWKMGDHPEVAPYEVPTTDRLLMLHSECSQPFANHGVIAQTRVCPSNWIIEREDGHTVVADRLDPYDTTGVVYVLDCRACDLRTTHATERARFETHAVHVAAHPAHVADAYEIVEE